MVALTSCEATTSVQAKSLVAHLHVILQPKISDPSGRSKKPTLTRPCHLDYTQHQRLLSIHRHNSMILFHKGLYKTLHYLDNLFFYSSHQLPGFNRGPKANFSRSVGKAGHPKGSFKGGGSFTITEVFWDLVSFQLSLPDNKL